MYFFKRGWFKLQAVRGKIYFNFFHLIFLYERETVFGCRAVPPAVVRCLFCCPAKGQKQVMYVEISTDRGKLWGCWLWYQFSSTRGGKKNHSSSSLIFHGNSPISPSLRSGLWFLSDYHIRLPPKWSPALFQLRMMISLLLHRAEGKNSSLLEHWCWMTEVTSEKKTPNNPPPSKRTLIKRKNNERKSCTKLETGMERACAFVQKMLISRVLQNYPALWL